MYPFERFTETSKKVLALAQEEAERAHHSYIGTEHLLLGLLRADEGLAAKVLASLEVEIDRVREAIESVLGASERVAVQQIIPTSRVKQVIEIAFERAKAMGDTHVGTLHVLLGLLVEGEGIAAHVLAQLDVDESKVLSALEPILEASGQEPTSPSVARPGGWVRAEFARAEEASGFGTFGPLGSFTSEAKTALAIAEEEAVKAALGYVGTEHLLLGLVRQAEGLAAQILGELGVTLEKVRQEIARAPQPSPRLVVPQVMPSNRLRIVIRVDAQREASGGPNQWVDTHHLLLALTSHADDPALRVLEALGAAAPAIREEAQRLRGD